MSQEPRLRVHRVTVENIGGAPSLVFKPEGGHAEIVGPNGSGKTRILEAIVAGMTGRDVNLSAGTDEGWIELALGPDGEELYEISRKVRRGKPPTLTVRKAGVRQSSPGAFLRDLCESSVTFDPLEWDRMNAVEKRTALVRAVGGALEELESRRADLFERRTDENRKLRDLKGQLAGMEKPKPETPTEPVDIGQLSRDFQELVEGRQRFDRWQSQASKAGQRVKELEEELARAKDARDEVRRQRVPEVSEERIEKAREALDEAEEWNAQVRGATAYRELEETVQGQATVVAGLAESLEDVERDKLKAIEESGLGIDGLELAEDGVMLEGVPVEKLNRAKRVELGLRIRAATSPRLGFVLIDDGSELGDDARTTVYSIAEAHDLQVLLTRVNADDDAPLEFQIVGAESDSGDSE